MRLKNLFYLLVILSLIILILPSFYATNNEYKSDETDTKPLLNLLEDTIGKIYKFFIELTEESIDVHSYDELENVINIKSNENSFKRYVINLQDDDYNITKGINCGNGRSTFIINGNNHTIDGKSKQQFMEVYGNLEVNNLTIQNTKYQKK